MTVRVTVEEVLMGAARGPYLDADIKADMMELIAAGYSPHSVWQELSLRFPDRDIPSERTIYRWARGRRPAPTALAWDWSEASGEDAALVLEALGAAIAGTNGRISRFSQQEGELILKIRKAAPNLPAATSWFFSQEYAAAKDTAHLDAALAVAQASQPGVGPSDAAVAAHVALHAGKWIDRPLVALAPTRAVVDRYIDEAGKHGSVDKENGFWWQPEGQFLWLLFERG
jgi:hypothetical protein